MAENPFLYRLPKARKGLGRYAVDFIQALVIFLASLVVIYLFVVIPNQVDGDSMMPNFEDNQLLFTNKIVQFVGGTEWGQDNGYDYKRGDVVIFQSPGHSDFIKRVIGLPGDRVKIQNGDVFVNGQKISEEYLPSGRETKTYSFIREGEERIVPPNQFFLLGDNRSNSKDSRFVDIGFVDREYIKGRVFLRYFPFEDFEVIRTGKITFN